MIQKSVSASAILLLLGHINHAHAATQSWPIGNIPYLMLPIYEQTNPLAGLVAVTLSNGNETRIPWRMYESVEQSSNRVLPYGSINETTEFAIYSGLKYAGTEPPVNFFCS